MSPTSRLAAGTIAIFALAGMAAHAETDYLWPRFSVDAGALSLSTQDEIRLNGELEILGRPVDFQTDFGLPDSKTALGLRLDWAFADRHSVDLQYYSLDRDASRSILREVEIGNIEFPIGASASASFKTTTIESSYTYWFLRNESFGLGGSFGLVYLGLDAGVSARGQFGPGGSTVSRSISESTDVPVPMIGMAVKGSPFRRLVLFAYGRILPSVSVGDYDGSAGSFGAGANYFLFGPLAVGASFNGTYYRAGIDTSNWEGDIDLSQNAWNLYLRAAW